MSDIDLDAIRQRRAKAERWYQGVHYGLKLYAASSDDVPVLLAELVQAHQRIADLERELDEFQREKAVAHARYQQRQAPVIAAAEALVDAWARQQGRSLRGEQLRAAVDTYREGRDGS